MGATTTPSMSLRDKISFFAQDAVTAVRQAVSESAKKQAEAEPVASESDMHAAAVHLAEDAAAHLTILAHDLKHGKRTASAEDVTKLNAIQHLSEEL
jgi:hypothetical protein